MVSNKDMVDPRSTGRRRARRSLFESFIDYKCIDCGKTSIEPPKDAPPWFEDVWPLENRVLNYSLQADHETKDMYENDEQHINWRCAKCHKIADMKTEKGESTIEQVSKLW